MDHNTQIYINSASTSGEFERVIILGFKRMRHSISEPVGTFDIPGFTVSRVERDDLMDGISGYAWDSSGRPRILRYREQKNLSRIIYTDGGAIMAQITSDFNAETTNKQLVCFAFFRFTISSVKTTADVMTSLILALSDEFKFHTFLSDDGVRLWRRACESTVPICLQNWWCFYNCMGQVNVLWVVSAALHKSAINKKTATLHFFLPIWNSWTPCLPTKTVIVMSILVLAISI